jgi:hypothetical protein
MQHLLQYPQAVRRLRCDPLVSSISWWSKLHDLQLTAITIDLENESHIRRIELELIDTRFNGPEVARLEALVIAGEARHVFGYTNNLGHVFGIT